VVEGALPLGKRLETVHHTSVETIGRGSDEQEGDPCVKDDDPEVKNVKLAGGFGRARKTGEVPLVVTPSPVGIEQMGVTRRTVNGNRTSTHFELPVL
jgi:hypothetical protein